MNVVQAAFHLVHDHAGGAEALGPMLGKAGATLSHEVNTNYPTYKLGLADAVKLTIITGDRRILNAFATACNCYPPVPMLVLPTEDASMAELMRRCGDVTRELADVVSQFQSNAADGDISRNDVAVIEREIDEAIRALTSFRHGLQAHVADRASDAPKRIGLVS